MKTTAVFRLALFALLLFFISGDLMAGPPPPPPPPCGTPPCPINIPIDGGVSILIAAGLAYGAKKAYDYGKKGH